MEHPLVDRLLNQRHGETRDPLPMTKMYTEFSAWGNVACTAFSQKLVPPSSRESLIEIEGLDLLEGDLRPTVQGWSYPIANT